MGARCSFDYAIIRVVPHVAREEFINAGAIVHCADRDFLGARIALDEARLLALASDVDIGLVRSHLEAIPRICAGGEDAGPIGRLSMRERWHWLIAPRSTILQTSPAHAGLDESPENALARIVERCVKISRRTA